MFGINEKKESDAKEDLKVPVIEPEKTLDIDMGVTTDMSEAKIPQFMSIAKLEFDGW